MQFPIGTKVRAKGFNKVFEVESFDEATHKYILKDSVPTWDENELELAQPRLRGFEVATSFEDKGVILPTRSTTGSAGYDFRVLTDDSITIKPNETHIFHTGVKAYMQKDEVLMIYPRSSMGIFNNIMIANSVPIIDHDYYGNPKNDGEIMIALHNYGYNIVIINNGDRVAQGIFTKYLTTDDDNVITGRIGGIGSTGVS